MDWFESAGADCSVDSECNLYEPELIEYCSAGESPVAESDDLFVFADAPDDAEPPDRISGIFNSVGRLSQINVTQDRLSIEDGLGALLKQLVPQEQAAAVTRVKGGELTKDGALKLNVSTAVEFTTSAGAKVRISEQGLRAKITTKPTGEIVLSDIEGLSTSVGIGQLQVASSIRQITISQNAEGTISVLASPIPVKFAVAMVDQEVFSTIHKHLSQPHKQYSHLAADLLEKISGNDAIAGLIRDVQTFKSTRDGDGMRFEATTTKDKSVGSPGGTLRLAHRVSGRIGTETGGASLEDLTGVTIAPAGVSDDVLRILDAQGGLQVKSLRLSTDPIGYRAKADFHNSKLRSVELKLSESFGPVEEHQKDGSMKHMHKGGVTIDSAGGPVAIDVSLQHQEDFDWKKAHGIILITGDPVAKESFYREMLPESLKRLAPALRDIHSVERESLERKTPLLWWLPPQKVERLSIRGAGASVEFGGGKLELAPSVTIDLQEVDGERITALGNSMLLKERSQGVRIAVEGICYETAGLVGTIVKDNALVLSALGAFVPVPLSPFRLLDGYHRAGTKIRPTGIDVLDKTVSAATAGGAPALLGRFTSVVVHGEGLVRQASLQLDAEGVIKAAQLRLADILRPHLTSDTAYDLQLHLGEHELNQLPTEIRSGIASLLQPFSRRK